MSIQKKERNKVGGGAGGRTLTSKVRFRVIELADPSVGRFKTSRVPSSLYVKGPPPGITSIDIVAQSIAPKCNYGVFNTKVLERLLKGSCNKE